VRDGGPTVPRAYANVKPLTHDPSRRRVVTGRRDGRHDGRYFLAAVLTAVKTGRVTRGAVTTAVKTAAKRQRPL